jgi:hypothetical protein
MIGIASSFNEISPGMLIAAAQFIQPVVTGNPVPEATVGGPIAAI